MHHHDADQNVDPNWTLDEYTDWHNKYAINYPHCDDWYATGPHWHRTVFFLDKLNNLPTKKPKILDAGCSNGGLLKFLTDPRGFHNAPTSKIVGFDIADYFVRNATKNAPDALCLVSPIEKIPFSDNTFDVVIAGEILEHVLDLEIALKEAARVLKPWGLLLTTTPSDPNSVGGPHLRYCDDKMLQGILPGIEMKHTPQSWLGCYQK